MTDEHDGQTRLWMQNSPDRPDLDELIRKSAEAYNALSPVDRAIADTRQRESWVRGEMGISHPEMTPEQLTALVQNNAQSILANEVERLRAALAQTKK